MGDLMPCTRAELDAFVAAYPRKLERDVFGAYEPPLVTYNDFTLGVWPESVVAAYSASIPAVPNASPDSVYAKDYPESNWQIARQP